jgi:hypothetical protein
MSFYSKTSYIKSESSFYRPIYGNYKFDTDLTNFGLMRERRVRKIGRSGSVLRLRKNSIYPMLDEFGYTFMDFFIFRSTWDIKYHFESVSSNNNNINNRYYIEDREFINPPNFDIGISYIDIRKTNF